MRIHISWAALLAAIIFLIALALLARTALSFLTPNQPATAAASPTPASPASPTLNAASDKATAAPTTGTPSRPSPSPSPAPVTPEPTTTSLPTGTATPPTTPQPPTFTPVQPPTRAPTPTPVPLTVTAQGFGQRGNQVSYAFVVNNPNPDLLAQNVRYQAAAFDAAGIVLLTDTSTIPQIGPGQQMGVSKTVAIPAGLTVARIEVLLQTGQFVQAPPLEMLQVSNIAFVVSDPPYVTGLLMNHLNRNLADLPVVGIAYDDGGIIGGGATVLPFAPAGAQVPISLPIVTDRQATRVEFYVPVSGPSS